VIALGVGSGNYFASCFETMIAPDYSTLIVQFGYWCAATLAKVLTRILTGILTGILISISDPSLPIVLIVLIGRLSRFVIESVVDGSNPIRRAQLAIAGVSGPPGICCHSD
jgi:hypothetical protein